MKLFNPDIIRHIILSMKDDKASLFCCLLINKTWSIQTIDILWSQPFRLLYSCASQVEDEFSCNCSAETRRLQAATLVNTCFSLIFQENEQKLIDNQLVQQGQILKPMFNYVDYLRSIDIHEMDLAMIDFYHFKEIKFKQIESSSENDPLTNTSSTKIIDPDLQTTTQPTSIEATSPQLTLNYSEIIRYLANPELITELRDTSSEYQIISEILLKFLMKKCKRLR